MTNRINRRQFLAGTAAAAGGFAAGFHAPAILRAAAADNWGDLVGRFVYDGTAPERKKLKVDKDIECCGKFDIRDESLMVGDDNGLANVYVYVRDRRVDVCPELAESVEKRVTLDNRDCIFKPHAMAIWTDKQEFYIVNSDPVAQNVAFSPLGDTPANIVLAVAANATWKFRRAQSIPVPIACNYHPWESAYILPRDNPYVAISAMDGTFRIPKLPVGKKLEFQAWQERVGYLDTPDWKKGRFEMEIKPGVNDLGAVKLPPKMFEK
ncbi:MAG: hypothetical protein HUU20_24240 [Pirellulales bacterium]|nr:hypothetical protein [Pirellulales bacterium]